jgi:ABC-type methionine transport system ATPase subunit
MTTTRRYKTASAMLDRVGLQEREYFLPSQLSGGQAQCVAIARALVNNPKLIIADEPTGNLDSTSSRLVMELLSEINKLGNTIIFVTHNPELTRFASRVVYMRDGAVVYDEQTGQGKVARRARRMMYTLPLTSEEDDLAGVSALMNVFANSSEGKASQRPSVTKTKSKRKSAVQRSKKSKRKTVRSR